MPYFRIETGKNKGKFKSPSGRILTFKQVKAYYAQKRKKSKPKK